MTHHSDPVRPGNGVSLLDSGGVDLIDPPAFPGGDISEVAYWHGMEMARRNLAWLLDEYEHTKLRDRVAALTMEC